MSEEFNYRESSGLSDSLNWRSQREASFQSLGLNARESSETQHIFERQTEEGDYIYQNDRVEEDEGEEEEIEKSSDYVEHWGISDDNFQKI